MRKIGVDWDNPDSKRKYKREWTRRNRAGLTTARRYRARLFGVRVSTEYLGVVRKVLRAA